jgi:hypothetical protein
MDGRHRFIAIVANDAFELGNPNTVEATMSEHIELFESFFKGGDTDVMTVFIAYQPRLVEDDQGKLVRARNGPAAEQPLPTRRAPRADRRRPAAQVPQGPNEILITQEMPHLVNKCCYFSRGDTVDAKNGVTVKSIENDISWCVSQPSQLALGLRSPAWAATAGALGETQRRPGGRGIFCQFENF